MSAKNTVYLSCFGVLLSTFFVFLPAMQAAQPGKVSKKINGLFAEARTNAQRLKLAALRMEPVLNSSGLNWKTHTAELMEIRELINKLGVTVKKLIAIRGRGSLHQKLAIAFSTLALHEMATSVNATIEHLNKNRQHIENCIRFDPEYKQLLSRNAALAANMAALITNPANIRFQLKRWDIEVDAIFPAGLNLESNQNLNLVNASIRY